MAAKNALGLKDLNVAAAVAGHKLYRTHAQKNPNLQANQILAKIPPNARRNYMQILSFVPSNLLDTTPMSPFRTTLQKLRQVQGGMREEVELLDEELAGDPPMVVVLKRKGVRIFPDGKRVALYVNDKLGLTFTVPYSTNKGIENPMVGVTEETEDLLETFEQLQSYATQENPKTTSKHFKFADGSKMPIAHGVAEAMHMIHGALNDENKKKYEAMLNEPKGFKKAADFALSRVQFTIGGK